MRIMFLALDVRLDVQQGDAIHVREIVRALGARGHRVALVTATREDLVPDLGPLVVHHGRREGTASAVRLCTRLARRFQADVVYERRLSPKIACAVSLLTHVPFVVEVNGVEEEAEMLGHSASSRWRGVRRAIRRRMFHRAARVVAVSERLADVVRKRQGLDAHRVVAIPNGVDPNRFAPVDASRARAKLGMPRGPWIVFVGNLVPWQGVDTLLQSLADTSMPPQASLAVVGGGILRGSLEKSAARLGIRGRVTFTDSVPHELVPLYLCASDVCVAPFTRARNEAIGPSPLKLYEYMACGRPVVASDLPGVHEVIVSSGGGVLVPPDDAAALSAAIADLLDRPSEARRMGERGRSFVLEEATWSKTAELVEDVLERAAGQG